MSESPNCWNCRFFKISWDPKFPYECQAMDFKSQGLPCQYSALMGANASRFPEKRIKSLVNPPQVLIDPLIVSRDQSLISKIGKLIFDGCRQKLEP